jgi:Na+-driven multidrug efflux pump
MIITRRPILHLFPIETEEAFAVASACLALYGVWLAFRMIPYTLICGIFRAGGDTKTGCFYDMLTLWGIGIPAVVAVWLLFHPPIVYIVAAMFLGEDLLKTFLCIRHFRSKKWIKQITLTK